MSKDHWIPPVNTGNLLHETITCTPAIKSPTNLPSILRRRLVGAHVAGHRKISHSLSAVKYGCAWAPLFAIVYCPAHLQKPPKTPPPTPATVSTDKPALAAAIKAIMAAEQLALGDPIVNSIGMVLIPIPSGTFRMGNPDSDPAANYYEKPEHLMQITRPFYLSAYEITQQQFERVTGKDPSEFKGATNPVERVSWYEAVIFCDELSKREGVEYRLPTEAEWEYACRAGTTTAYSFGDDKSQLGKYAWFSDNSDNTTHPVGEKLANRWVLFDMHGNVWEWCQDWRGTYETKQMLIDPSGPASGSRRVLRGGAFNNLALEVRAAYRYYNLPGYRNHLFGFRLARTYDLSP